MFWCKMQWSKRNALGMDGKSGVLRMLQREKYLGVGSPFFAIRSMSFLCVKLWHKRFPALLGCLQTESAFAKRCKRTVTFYYETTRRLSVSVAFRKQPEQLDPNSFHYFISPSSAQQRTSYP